MSWIQNHKIYQQTRQQQAPFCFLVDWSLHSYLYQYQSTDTTARKYSIYTKEQWSRQCSHFTSRGYELLRMHEEYAWRMQQSAHGLAGQSLKSNLTPLSKLKLGARLWSERCSNYQYCVQTTYCYERYSYYHSCEVIRLLTGIEWYMRSTIFLSRDSRRGHVLPCSARECQS